MVFLDKQPPFDEKEDVFFIFFDIILGLGSHHYTFSFVCIISS